MTVSVQMHAISKNRGLTEDGIPVIRFIYTDPHGVTYSPKKRIPKIGPVDEICFVLPRDDCFSRLDNWRKLMRNDDEGYSRSVRTIHDGDTIIQADLMIDEDDPQEWDVTPTDWTGTGWVPFYFKLRPKDFK